MLMSFFFFLYMQITHELLGFHVIHLLVCIFVEKLTPCALQCDMVGWAARFNQG